MADLQESAAVSTCDDWLPAGRASPLQVNHTVSGSKLQKKWTAPHSQELFKLASTLLSSTYGTRNRQDGQESPYAPSSPAGPDHSMEYDVCKHGAAKWGVVGVPPGSTSLWGQGQRDPSQCFLGASSQASEL